MTITTRKLETAADINALIGMIAALEGWGESASSSADYLELGFSVLESEAIVAWNA